MALTAAEKAQEVQAIIGAWSDEPQPGKERGQRQTAGTATQKPGAEGYIQVPGGVYYEQDETEQIKFLPLHQYKAVKQISREPQPSFQTLRPYEKLIMKPFW